MLVEMELLHMERAISTSVEFAERLENIEKDREQPPSRYVEECEKLESLGSLKKSFKFYRLRSTNRKRKREQPRKLFLPWKISNGERSKKEKISGIGTDTCRRQEENKNSKSRLSLENLMWKSNFLT